ncbi:hypothetical protein EQ718_08255 [Paracoccus versutus]|uniref:Uncharacterized protein n=1 Tax=Paracoccus versutus TaxID=34007 RepID=A0AAQ0HIM6_PARVE|nr:hypothetical protein [Paracoccus versutus]KGJ11373.1 hypothetical protein IT40_07330 [Paracoccus versutus]REG53176.1 hypothetical protein ATH84_100773 [Paracoccus versutus]WEJ78873.1 hypothetical protein EQ718_08255 [Paracoccus versutus]
MTNDLEARIAELRQRRRAGQEDTEVELDRLKAQLSEHVQGIRAGMDDELVDRIAEFATVGKLAAKALETAERIHREHEALGERITAHGALLRRQARFAWAALGGACLAAGAVLLLVIWTGAALKQAAAREADIIRATNIRELAAARDEGERAIATLHEQLAGQRTWIERSIETVGVELASLTAERDAVRAELEHFAALRDRLGIRLIETRTQPVIVVPEGQEIRLWRAAGLHELARYNGRMYRVLARD